MNWNISKAILATTELGLLTRERFENDWNVCNEDSPLSHVLVVYNGDKCPGHIQCSEDMQQFELYLDRSVYTEANSTLEEAIEKVKQWMSDEARETELVQECTQLADEIATVMTENKYWPESTTDTDEDGNEVMREEAQEDYDRYFDITFDALLDLKKKIKEA